MLLAGVGLALYLATLPLYSATVTPFQRFSALSEWIGLCAPRMHIAVIVCVALFAVLRALHAPRISDALLVTVGGVFFVGSDVAFALFATRGLPGGMGMSAEVWLLSFALAIGSVAIALLCGRAFARLPRRASLGAVAIAGLGQSAAGELFLRLPAVPMTVVFGLLSALAVAALIVRPADISADATGDEAPRKAASAKEICERIRSFLIVAGPAILGLVAFAFVTGLMRALVVGHYTIQIASLAASSAVIGVFAATRLHAVAIRLSNRVVIPLLAVMLLAAGDIVGALGLSSTVTLALTYLLYTYAALLTLAMLAAIANAREFSDDVIFAFSFGLFSLASLPGLEIASMLADEGAVVVTTIVTTVYAIAMVIPTVIARRDPYPSDALLDGNGQGSSDRLRSSKNAADRGSSNAGASASAGTPDATAKVRTPGEAGSSASADVAIDWERNLERRCAEIAEQYELTARETEILGYLASGHGSAYISETLYISPNTVRTHVHNLYGKLGVGSREEIIALVRHARQDGGNRA
jgi:DNA-binding CsgD family transcriptional regulator